jgi:hypothetical protein
MEQMNKALISLNDMYDKAAAWGLPAPNGKKEPSQLMHEVLLHCVCAMI